MPAPNIRHIGPRCALAVLAVVVWTKAEADPGAASRQEFGVAPSPGPIEPDDRPSPPQPQERAPSTSQGLSLIGAWSGTGQISAGQISATDVYAADGRYVSVALLSGQYMFRTWGNYSAERTGPARARLRLHPSGYLPRQICKASQGGAPSCQPFTLPNETIIDFVFTSPNTAEVTAEGQNQILQMQRDPNPALLQRQVQQTIFLPADEPVPPPPPPGLCQLGQTQCFSGYVRVCEQMATGGTWWVTGSQQCDASYGPYDALKSHP